MISILISMFTDASISWLQLSGLMDPDLDSKRSVWGPCWTKSSARVRTIDRARDWENSVPGHEDGMITDHTSSPHTHIICVPKFLLFHPFFPVPAKNQELFSTASIENPPGLTQFRQRAPRPESTPTPKTCPAKRSETRHEARSS